MTEKIYVVTDLGPGDGGKGGVVHKIATMKRAHTIVKVGGAQGSHGVFTSRGEKFAFSQWGCGTFEGIRTHLSPRIVVSPIGLLNESAALRYEHGIHDPFSLLTIDETALCATPYHGISSRLKEMARKNNPRGTIGTGVGEAYRYSLRHPDLTIRVGDLSRRDFRDLLAAIRERIRLDLDPIIKGGFLASDCETVKKETGLLEDDGFLDYIAEQFGAVSRLANIVDGGYLERKILSQNGIIVVESSHGVLTDHYCGFHPHTSAIRTLPCFARTMLQQAGYGGKIIDIGVFRAYSIRHGAGPMPTADPKMADSLLPGSHKDYNRYQGEIRVGPIDFVLLRYSLSACGGPKAFDGLAVTWFDQILAGKNMEWKICDRYADANAPTYFTDQGEIRTGSGADEGQLEYQEKLGKRLLRCKPEITAWKIPTSERDEVYSFCADAVEERLGVPVRMISFGPTELDKICR